MSQPFTTIFTKMYNNAQLIAESILTRVELRQEKRLLSMCEIKIFLFVQMNNGLKGKVSEELNFKLSKIFRDQIMFTTIPDEEQETEHLNNVMLRRYHFYQKMMTTQNGDDYDHYLNLTAYYWFQNPLTLEEPENFIKNKEQSRAVNQAILYLFPPYQTELEELIAD